ncbi:MmcQ/YjbR family DNA-binding protein [Segeticoccus rhizosphaerae]|uniref:MmcQ/YjbR family DNA-binding protein n=1 Tax=Segeticoccus rhizosphaerae TaxID=1104777 RepID=UPI0010BFB940|nr:MULTISPECIES: MmcQ/YjbR family DNA-binding protein [Intrasporangiaceae]
MSGGADPLERLRRLCLALPEVTERLSHGEPTWFVRDKKTFVMYADHHHDERLAFWAAAPEGAQQVLVTSGPEHFFRPPYVGGRGWVGVYLDVDVEWDHVERIVEDAYRRVAPKRLLAALDSAGSSPVTLTPKLVTRDADADDQT